MSSPEDAQTGPLTAPITSAPAAANAHRLQLQTRAARRFSELEAALEAALPDDPSPAPSPAPGAASGASAPSTSPARTPLWKRALRVGADRTARAARFVGSYLSRRTGTGTGTGSGAADDDDSSSSSSDSDSDNEAGSEVRAGDTVWMLDNVAYVDAAAAAAAAAATSTGAAGDASASPVRAEYVVAVLAQHEAGRVEAAARAVAATLDPTGVDEAVLATITARVTPFLQAVRPGRRVAAVHGGSSGDGGDGAGWRLELGPVGPNGIASDVVQLPAAAPGAVVATRAAVPAGADGELAMETLFAAAAPAASEKGAGGGGGLPRPWGVISDIDDTIKVTQTSDPVGILRTTFAEAPAPVAGMPALYAALRARLGPAAPFFYLSASPYPLYPFLRAFRRAHYPAGALILRDASPTRVAGLLSTLTLGTQAYKVDRMRKVHGWLPATTFVCVGDSTQSDPEAYGEIYRTFPGWVGLILIRKVTDIAALGIDEKNAPARFEQAFAGVPRAAWHVFEDPSECYAVVERVVGSQGSR